MSRADVAAAKMRQEIRTAKENDTFMNRNVVFVMHEDGAERFVHLPRTKYFNFLSKQ